MNLSKQGLRPKQVKLANLTTIKIGGEANCFLINSVDSLRQALLEFGQSYYFLGGGSNILVKDGLIKQPVLTFDSAFNYIKFKQQRLEVGAGVGLSQLLGYCVKARLAGLENLAGIPAKLGAMLVINASAFGAQISDCLNEVEAVDNYGKVWRFNKTQLSFTYRGSSLKGFLVTRAWFCLKTQDIKPKISEIIAQRIKTQDVRYPSCGCVFKNPQNLAAGQLLDSCGLKGQSKGKAAISRQHANFIINTGGASYADVDYLINLMKDKVYQKYQLELEEEIVRWI